MCTSSCTVTVIKSCLSFHFIIFTYGINVHLYLLSNYHNYLHYLLTALIYLHYPSNIFTTILITQYIFTVVVFCQNLSRVFQFFNIEPMASQDYQMKANSHLNCVCAVGDLYLEYNGSWVNQVH